MGIAALDDLAVELEHEAQDAVRRGVLRPEVQVEVPDPLPVAGKAVRSGRSVHHSAPSASAPAGASSCGTSRAPSHGLSKSKRLYS